jgi:hypothetical protein
MSSSDTPPARFASFREFCPFYLNEHRNRTCRRLDFVGSSLALVCLALVFVTGSPWWILAGLLCGYGCAWIGHFLFEKNRPATFTYPPPPSRTLSTASSATG